MLDLLVNIVLEASQLMQTEDFSISQKEGVANIVTSSDIAVQDIHDLSHEYLWIIDPIDGTANYSRGIRECAICVFHKTILRSNIS